MSSLLIALEALPFPFYLRSFVTMVIKALRVCPNSASFLIHVHIFCSSKCLSKLAMKERKKFDSCSSLLTFFRLYCCDKLADVDIQFIWGNFFRMCHLILVFVLFQPFFIEVYIQ